MVVEAFREKLRDGLLALRRKEFPYPKRLIAALLDESHG